ncbi:hypothetical protein [Mycoplasma sp. Mirounga ES2805-ORL]|uniref:hypothetical protein n=1 Tax=Mycoplasma sp. Mirounga ES2805-ORL TaxID=754514 RepID=UPI00197B1123|nr:hypothetical protein [Mycoplasma sp. Mirounga ES2805-ORL]QSF13905.1 hypothetical protein JXZ90_01220 [Mycoplasma sp. Mirounga ES2805-ORL]
MDLDVLKKLFIDSLESTPGIKSISNSEYSENDIVVEEINGKFCFKAQITILRNESAKNIINLVSSHLRYKLKESGSIIGKINLIIGGITNE